MTGTSAPRPFTPSQESPADLDARTVGRADILATLAQRLTAAATGRSRPHTLLVGPRGSGKTHLLWVALYRLDQEPGVRDRLAIAQISEDAVGITRYSDLLWEIGAALGLGLSRSGDVAGVEAAILAGIGDRTLVVVLENLDRVFRSLGVPGQQNLRSWVETSGRVLLLAATSALFAGVRERSQPWFAGFITTPVEGLSATEGRELLTVLGERAGDHALAEFLRTERGRARVEAVAQLTGGSARIWMVLSGCLTVESLDALVPAVEQLVEGLVPYYQQLLWDLSDNHQAIVRQLAEGPDAALTAADIAAATGLSQQTVSKALSLLQESHWVRAERSRGDQRKTWYSLREPMLRHHFQWRTLPGEPLNLIVELLRAWYEPHELRRHLAGAQPASPAETYLAESVAGQHAAVEAAYAAQDPGDLAAEARGWIRRHSDVFTPDCGRYAEACLALARDPALDVSAHLRRRTPSADDAAVAAALTRNRGAGMAALLAAAAAAATGDTAAGLTLLAAGWVGGRDPRAAYDLLAQIRPESVASHTLAFAVRIEALVWRHESWTSASGVPRPGLADARNLLAELLEAFGQDHHLTLLLRSHIAYYTGQAGDAAEALALYQRLLPDTVRVFGSKHPYTLTIRRQVAVGLARTGLVDEAVEDSLLGDDRLLTDAVLDVLRVAPTPPTKQPLLANIWRAINGDPEAEVRLPAELHDIISTLRQQQ